MTTVRAAVLNSNMVTIHILAYLYVRDVHTLLILQVPCVEPVYITPDSGKQMELQLENQVQKHSQSGEKRLRDRLEQEEADTV